MKGTSKGYRSLVVKSHAKANETVFITLSILAGN